MHQLFYAAYKGETMDESRFWEIMDKLDWEKNDDDSILFPVTELLSGLTDEEIFAFDDIMAKLLYDIDGRFWLDNISSNQEYMSGDEFLYIRCVALINGKQYYEQIKSGERALDPCLEFESVLYTAGTAWGKKHRKDYEEYPHITALSFETGSNSSNW